LPIGKAQSLRQGSRIAIMLFGSLLTMATDAADKLDATLINMRFVKPMDEAMIQEMASTHDLIVTLEDNAIQGGAGSGLSEVLSRLCLSVPVLHLGIPDVYVDHAEREAQLAEIGLSAESIVEQICEFADGRFAPQPFAKVATL